MEDNIIKNILDFLSRAYRGTTEVEAHRQCVEALINLKLKQDEEAKKEAEKEDKK